MSAPPHHHAFRAALVLGLVVVFGLAVAALLHGDGLSGLPGAVGDWLTSRTGGRS